VMVGGSYGEIDSGNRDRAVSSRAWWVRRFMMILFHAEDETANDRDEEKGL
jgi:hypothetical protein